MVGHEEVQDQIDGEEQIEEQSHDDPRQVVCFRKGDPRWRDDAH